MRFAVLLFVVMSVQLGACGSSVQSPRADTPAMRTDRSAASAGQVAASTRLSSDEPTVIAGQLVELARAGDRAVLERHVDWDYVGKLARVSAAFVADTDHLIVTLAGIPASCTPVWTSDDGGHRLDFPPAMVDDPDDLAAEKDAVKAELYRGVDVIASCDGSERAMVQLVRDPAGEWRVRGWARLAR